MKKLLTIITIFVTSLLQSCSNYNEVPLETTEVVSKIYFKKEVGNQYRYNLSYEAYLCDGNVCDFYNIEEIIYNNYNVGDSLIIVKSNGKVINIHPKF